MTVQRDVPGGSEMDHEASEGSNLVFAELRKVEEEIERLGFSLQETSTHVRQRSAEHLHLDVQVADLGLKLDSLHQSAQQKQEELSRACQVVEKVVQECESTVHENERIAHQLSVMSSRAMSLERELSSHHDMISRVRAATQRIVKAWEWDTETAAAQPIDYGNLLAGILELGQCMDFLAAHQEIPGRVVRALESLSKFYAGTDETGTRTRVSNEVVSQMDELLVKAIHDADKIAESLHQALRSVQESKRPTSMDHTELLNVKHKLEVENANLENKLKSMEADLARNLDVAINDEVVELRKYVQKLVEESKNLAEDGNLYREEIRKCEVSKRTLSDQVQVLEGVNQNLTQQNQSLRDHMESVRADLESRFFVSENNRRQLDIELKLVEAENARLNEEVKRLNSAVSNERKARVEAGDIWEGMTVGGEVHGTSKQPDLQAHNSYVESVNDLKAKLDASKAEAMQQRKEINELRTALDRSRESLRAAQEELRALQQTRVAQTFPDDQVAERERMTRIRSLQKENAECHAQLNQLSKEVVGLTDALEMVTKRAQDKDRKYIELQAKMDKIIRVASLVDPQLALDHQFSKVKPTKTKQKRRTQPAFTKAPPHSLATPLSSAGLNGTPGRPKRVENLIADVEGVYGRPRMAHNGVQRRPQSARARMELEVERMPGNRMEGGGEEGGYEYGRRLNRPLSANSGRYYRGDDVIYPPHLHEESLRDHGAQLDSRGSAQEFAAQGIDVFGTLRPLSHFLQSVREGSIIDETPICILVEYCNSEKHARRYDIQQYQLLYERLCSCLLEELRGKKFTVVGNRASGSTHAPEVEPRPGAFEIYVEWQDAMGDTNTVLLFSKLERMQYPNPETLATRIRTMLEERV
eukprot:758488-Hanusia_phi.AAC.1